MCALLCVGAEDEKLCSPPIGSITLVLAKKILIYTVMHHTLLLEEKTQRRLQVSFGYVWIDVLISPLINVVKLSHTITLKQLCV